MGLRHTGDPDQYLPHCRASHFAGCLLSPCPRAWVSSKVLHTDIFSLCTTSQALDAHPKLWILRLVSIVVDLVKGTTTQLKLGDRVTSLCFLPCNKGFQLYTVQPRNVVAKIPDALSFEKSVTYPENLVTAFFKLFDQLSLPEPDDWPAKTAPTNNPPICRGDVWSIHPPAVEPDIPHGAVRR